jgi:regulator of protease activity HflC (stomatin/prohibitin superfamily)
VGNALDWIGNVVETILKCLPHLRIIKLTQGGVKMRRGNEITVLTPGLWWYWPIITTIDVVTTVRDTVDLNGQTFTTKDNKSVLTSGMVMFTVTDVEKLLTSAPDYTNTICDVSMNVIHDVMIQYSWEDLRAGIMNGTINKELRKEAQKELAPFGIKIISLGLKDLAPVRVLKIVQDS